MATFEVDVQGATYEVDAPDETTAWKWANATHNKSPETSMMQDIGQGVGNLAAGAVRGAGSIGSTLLAPYDIAKDALSGKGLSLESNRQRRASIDAGLQEMGAEPDSWMYQGGKLAGEIAGTAGAGGVAANVAGRVLPQTPRAIALANAIRSGGFSTGMPAAKALSMEGVKNAATRIGGGAIAGGTMAGAINPESAPAGALIGGAFPVAGKLAGESGRLLREYTINPLFKPSKAAIAKLVEDSGGIEQAKAAIDRAIAAGKTMSGESYTLGQAGKNAGISATERARSAVMPENFQKIYQAQRAARVKALEGISRDEVVLENAIANRAENARDVYGTVRDKVFTGGDDIAGLLGRARAGGALTEAQKIAAIEGRKFSIPVVDDLPQAAFGSADDATRALYGGMKEPGTVTLGGAPVDMPSAGNRGLLAEIRRLGGVSTRDMRDLIGEKATNKAGAQVGVFTKKGEEVGDMVRRLVDRGVMPRHVLNDVDGGAQALRDAVQRELAGGADDMALRAAAESYYGAPEVLPLARETLMRPAGVSPEPLREVIGQAIKGGDLHSVKMGIDQAIGNATGHQKAALVQLKKEFVDWLGDKSPEYLAANAQYAADSRGINQMKIAQKLTDALTGPAYAQGAEPGQAIAGYLRALKNAPAIAKRETGMRQPLNKIFDEGQMSTIKQVAKELAKDVDLNTLGKGVGSDTAQKMARSNMLSSLAELANTSRVGRAAANVVSLGSKGRINQQLDAMLTSPEYAGKALSELTKSQRSKLADLLANPAVRALPIAAQSR